MSRPTPYLFRMCVFLAAVAAVMGVLYPQVERFFMANPALNGLILGALAIGILFIFRQAMMLRPEVEWLETFRGGGVSSTQPRLLAPMAQMLGDRHRGGPSGRLSLSAIATRSLLDGVSARLDESREISRYLIGLMIFLGLLGTFWGLLQTVSTIGGVISGLKVGNGDAVAIFAELQQGLAAPLAGMGTAFSASLFGLAGSLVLGFLELQAGQAQNRFYMDLEDWLAGSTRIGGGGMVEAGDQPVPAYIQALLETTAENIEKLQYTMAQGEDNRRSANNHLVALAERLATLSDQMKAEQ
ncbi:hypothetical protein, partial [Azospirillum sp. B4]|uniref:hypothetical protein n=1 Tax=Azospirillum sp. B4 TaxID=95605 RepID=UPI0005C910B1